MNIVILDDYQDAVRKLRCASKLEAFPAKVFTNTVKGVGQLAIRLRDADILVLIRDRTTISRQLVEKLPRLKLIVHLVRKETLERDYERLPYEPLTQDVLGVPVRKVVIQVVAGRNIAVLVEAAVRNTILQLRGIDTYAEFARRQREAMER